MRRIALLAALVLCAACDRTPATLLTRADPPKLDPGWKTVRRKGVDFTIATPQEWITKDVDLSNADADLSFIQSPVDLHVFMKRVVQRQYGLAVLNLDLMNIGGAIVVHTDEGHNLILSKEADDMEKSMRSLYGFRIVGREDIQLPVGKAIRVKCQAAETKSLPCTITGYVMVHGSRRFLAVFLSLTGGAEGSMPTRKIMSTFRLDEQS